MHTGVVLRLKFVVLALALIFFNVVTGCGGSGSTTSTGTTTPTPPTQANNPTPSVSSFAPASIVAGSAAQTLTVMGTGFIASSVVDSDGSALTTTYVSATELKAALPAAAVAGDGTLKITVTNPAPGGGMSSVSNYTVTVPTAAVSSLSPQVVPQGQAATIDVSGTGFEANSVAQWNGSARPTAIISATSLKITLTAADTKAFGTGKITVVNPGLASTTPLELVVNASTPTITSVSPNAIQSYSNSSIPQQVLIYGSGFAAAAGVQANGAPATVIAQNSTVITVSLPSSLFATTGSISLVVTNPGPPAVSSNAELLSVTSATAPAYTVFPNSAPAGSPDTTITLNGSGFFPDSVVEWNSTSLKTTYSSSSSVTAVIPASLLAGFAQANINVSTPENANSPAPSQPFDTFLELPLNDIVYNPKDGFIYGSVPGYAGQGLGNSIAAIDPADGVVQKTIFVGSEPNRLALSDDGTQLFVGLDGAGSVRQVDLTSSTAGVQFSLGGGPGVYNPPYTAVSLAVLPGQANSVAVYGTNGVVTIFDSGVARPNASSGLQTYFDSNVGALAFGSSASTLYVTSEAIGSNLYSLTVDYTGISAFTLLGTNAGGTTMQYDNGRLYFPSGTVVNAANDNQLGQFSILNNYSTTPVAAAGPIVSDSTLNRAWIVPNTYGTSTQLLSFDETTFNAVSSIPVTGIGSVPYQAFNSNPADLIRWGGDGLAFHTANQLYVLQGAIVKDNSSSPADVAVSVQAPSAGTTGSALTYTFQVQNLGPNTAQGVTLIATLPSSFIFGSISATSGSCTGTSGFYCDLGSINSGSSASVTITATPSTAGAAAMTAHISSVSYDPLSTNNQATASTTVTGGLFSPQPAVTQLSPALVQAGNSTFTLTVNGSGFSSASSILWNGTALPTMLVSSGQLTATVDASLVSQLGWSQVSVSSAAPGGGQSGSLTFSIYQVLNVPANAMSFDPFTRKLYAVLPSTSASLTGNSIVAIDPASGSIGNPIQVGSEPNLLSETSDGNYLFIGLSGAKSLGRFNLQTQALDLTIPLTLNETYQPGSAAAMAIATVPGSDTSLAVEIDSFDGIGIFDISGSTGTYRKNSGSGYSGDYPVFTDSTHFYAHDAYTSGAEFYRYSVDANGAELIDGTTLDGLGGFGGQIAVDGGLVYGTGGGIINPNTTPPSQIAVLPLGVGPYGDSLVGGGAVPYAAEMKSFNIGVNDAGTAFSYVERFDTQHFTLEQTLQLPSSQIQGVNGTRWAQDGLAFIIPSTTANSTSSQIFLLRGPFILPAEAVSNPAPVLGSTDHNSVQAGSGNFYLTLTGSQFLPGATALWNGSARTTTFIDSQHLSVAISSSDVSTAGSIAITGQNPGSGISNTINVTVQ